MLYGSYLLKNKIKYSKTSATSGVAPLISGTVGLMFSLYPCLPVDEVEGILKLTALNIDDIEANKPYAAYYGAGMLQTGDAVEMVYQLYSDKETATIEGQDFSRWDFKLTSLSEGVVMRNQIFREDAKLHLKAKNSVVLSQNTHLKPNTNGGISIKIDPMLQKECDLRLRDPSIEKWAMSIEYWDVSIEMWVLRSEKKEERIKNQEVKSEKFKVQREESINK